MPLEAMITEAILVDKFTPVLRKLADAQDGYARKTMAMNTAGNALLAVGGGLTALLVNSVKVAGQFDQIRRGMVATVGAAQALADSNYVDKFAQHSSQRYYDLYLAAGRLDAQHVSVTQHLQDMADIAAATHAPLSELASLYDRLLAGGQTGRALGQVGFPRFGISTKEIFAAAGLPYTPGQKIYGAITPEQADAALHKIIQEKGWGGLDTKMARTTLSGSETLVIDAGDRIMKGLGGANLQPTIQALDHIADSLNAIGTFITNHPRLTLGLEVGAGGALLVGGILKGRSAWRTYKDMLAAVKVIADTERAGEVEKIGVAGQEATAIGKSAFAVDGLRGKLARIGIAYSTEAQAAGGFEGALATGITTIGLYGVALAGVAVIAYEVGDALYELKRAQDSVADASAASQLAISQGYDVMDAKPTGDAARSYGQNWLRSLGNVVTFGHFFKDDPGGYGPQINKALIEKAKKDGMPKHGIRAAMLAAQKAEEEAARAAALAAARQRAQQQAAANSQADDLALDNDQTMMRISQLDYNADVKRNAPGKARADLAAYNNYRKLALAAASKDITTWEQVAANVERTAGHTKDYYAAMKHVLELKEKQAEIDDASLGGDKRSALDRTIATIIGGGGITEGELTKMGLNRRLFSELTKGRLPVDATTARIKAAAKRPVIVNVIVDGKVLQKIRQQAVDQALSDIISAASGIQHVIPGGGL